MEVMFYICASAVLLIIGGVVAIFLTTTDQEKEEAGYSRSQPTEPWFIRANFKPGDRLYAVRFVKIDGQPRRFDEFIVIEVVGQCVVGWEIPNNGQPQKRSFNVNRLITACRK